MKMELSKYRVKAEAHDLADEWLDFLNEHHKEVLLTLEDEAMIVENIFKEVAGGDLFLYWYSIQGVPKIEVNDSDHWVDKKHVEYWRKCIDTSFPAVDLSPSVTMIPPLVESFIDAVL